MARLNGPRPRVLHLFSDWKWTGPAEPVVNLCRALRRHGHVVDLATAKAPSNSMAALERRARERAVEPITDLALRKGVNPFAVFAGINQVTEFIDREEVQIVHVHSGYDHLIGSRAARRANNQPFVVRTNHTGMPLAPTFFRRFLIRGHTQGWVALTRKCAKQDAEHFGIPPARAIAVEGAIDLAKFNPAVTHPDVRPALGLGPENVIAAVVARVQSHRRFDVLLPALARAMKEEPALRAAIIGRGTHIGEIAKEPARELGIADKVIFTGYRREDYVAHLAAIDFEIFLVPGSDGSCRAAREAMAMGKPILAANRGLLPELVEDGICGLVVDDTEENLTQAILRMARSRRLREKLGKAAAAKAKDKFDIEQQMLAISGLYQRLVEEA